MTTDETLSSSDAPLADAPAPRHPPRSNNEPLVLHPACGFALPANWITLGAGCIRPDPRPGPRATKEAGIGGALKVRVEDFIVEEIPIYDPSGEGEHIFLGVQKSGMPHSEMLGVIGRHFSVDEMAIGFAGMKDRAAVTQQTISVHLPVHRPVGELIHPRLMVLWAKRHTNKIRRGHLKGNRFVIRIRNVDPMQVRTVKARMEALAVRGIPDYFGEQRFGYRVNNHVLGLHYARMESQEILDEMLGSRGTPFPPYQQAVRECYDRGEFAAAGEMWGRHDQAERIAVRALARGRDAAGAIRAIPAHTKNFWLSALQGAVFNATLGARVADGTFCKVLAGDVAIFTGKGSVFATAANASESELADLAARCASLEISAAGPIHGPKMVAAEGAPLAYEHAALAACGADESMFTPPALEGDGARRPLRITMSDWSVDAGVDDHGGYIRLAFDLQKGAFATVLCREIMGEGVESSEPSRDGD